MCDPDSESNNDVLRIAKTILHEGLHADLWNYVIENLPEGEDFVEIERATFNQTFAKLFDLSCSAAGFSDQHEVMMNTSIQLISESLHLFNDGIGEPKDYEYLAWLGIWQPDVPCIEQKISESELVELRTRYESNVTLSPNILCQ